MKGLREQAEAEKSGERRMLWLRLKASDLKAMASDAFFLKFLDVGHVFEVDRQLLTLL